MPQGRKLEKQLTPLELRIMQVYGPLGRCLFKRYSGSSAMSSPTRRFKPC